MPIEGECGEDKKVFSAVSLVKCGCGCGCVFGEALPCGGTV